MLAQHVCHHDTLGQYLPSIIAARPNSVIDLTGDDDEDTAKALAASMETHTTFGPSNRVDEKRQWAMVPSVPSNVCDHIDALET